MKRFLKLATITSFAFASVATAQQQTVTFIGQLTQADTVFWASGTPAPNWWNSSVAAGTPFTFNLTYSVTSPDEYPSQSDLFGSTTQPPNGGVAVAVGNYNFGGGPAIVQIYDNSTLFGPPALDAYSLRGQPGNVSGLSNVTFGTNLWSNNLSLITSELPPVSEHPISAFDRLNLFTLSGFPTADTQARMFGTVSSYSVAQAPEPSSALLLLSGVVFVMRRRTLRTNERNA